jgi:hypothetical protein
MSIYVMVQLNCPELSRSHVGIHSLQSLCRSCKSIEDLNKHFRQLHQREHEKRLKGPRCAGSDKEKRYKYGCPTLACGLTKSGSCVEPLAQTAGVMLLVPVAGASKTNAVVGTSSYHCIHWHG